MESAEKRGKSGKSSALGSWWKIGSRKLRATSNTSKKSPGEGSVILTGVVKPHDDLGVASEPSSSTSLHTLQVPGLEITDSDPTNNRFAVSENNLKSASSLGNILETHSQLKSLSTSNIVKNKIMAPTSKSSEKDNVPFHESSSVHPNHPQSFRIALPFQPKNNFGSGPCDFNNNGAFF